MTEPPTFALGPSPSAEGTPEPAGGDLHAIRWAGLDDGLGSLPGSAAGLLWVVLVGLTSVALTVLRRRHARRLMASRVAARLAAFVGPRSTGTQDLAPERDLSVVHPR